MSNEVTRDDSPSSNAHERIERTASRVKEGTHSAVSGAKDKFDNAADRVDAGLQSATDASARGAHRATDKASELRDRAGDALDSGRGFVREKPVQSVAIALAAGWLLGKLMSSRR